ncbi:DNA topoisomerase I [Nibricoccus aquaticus]|uniref:DNA topoisomerase n=1 Tax=Nibricoccus aquaticus TaxID=2576891 RepID=A0A290Q7Y0_9BACT|nr:DNA topoisomerase IB [Nibricoccus aquaticus]ATC64357.1 DNA topoisomerase I [Nibricoccus aquaticus]
MASIALMDSAGAAKEAGLRYVTDDSRGITRRRAGKAFRYLMPDGAPVKNADTLARIRSLAIPPAWSDVWICPLTTGHLQATGRDVRNRKQHRYHPEWRAIRDQTKYERMIAFGRVLPALRRKVERDLRRLGTGREKVLAAVTRLLEATLIRVGNEEYVRQNGSFGLSTLRDRHVSIRGGTMHFAFLGKSGKRHAIDLHDPRLAKIVRSAQELPGQTLFQYEDEAGNVQKIASEDVNAYLREIGGEEFSAKDFRTWAATVLAAEALRGFECVHSKVQAKKNVISAIKHVAERLGNTPAICRKSYIHPVILNSYLDGLTVTVMKTRAEKISRGSLTPIEAAVLEFLQKQLTAAQS